MEFKKYSSIINSHNGKFIKKIREFGFDQYEYCITEKVHGSNFAIYYDGKKFRIASRNKFLADDADFFGCQKLLPELKEKIRMLYGHFWCAKELVVFGELCGGRYPHKEVKQKNSKKVQGHVWYHPDNLFYVFDIKINGKYITAYNVYLSCLACEFFCVSPMFVGTFDECLKYSNAYQTTIPTQFGLPEIKDNICEGNVIKPIVPLFFPNGERVMLKNKNDKFKEISRKKEKKDVTKKVELSERGNKLLAELLSHVTENRLNNVISKIGEVTIKDFGDIMHDFNLDVQSEFKKSFGEELEYLEKDEIKLLNKSLNKEAANLIRTYLTQTNSEDS